MFEGARLYIFTPDTFNLTSLETMTSLFHKCHNLFLVNFPKTNSINLKDISYMFSECGNLV